MIKNLTNVFQKNLCKPSKGFFTSNRQRLLKVLQDSNKFDMNGIIFLKGPIEQAIYDDDTEYLVSPENLFWYLFGIQEPDTYAIIELNTGKSTIFLQVPDVAKTYWQKIKSLDDYQEEFEIDDAQDLKNLKSFFDNNVKNSTVYIYKGINPFSNLESHNPEKEFSDILSEHKVDNETLYEYACEARVHKSQQEVHLIQQSVDLATLAHLNAWNKMKPGLTEQQISNEIYSYNKFMANAKVAYENIVGTGKNAAILHYPPSNFVKLQDGQLCLIDAGARMYGYCSDITRTVPVNGKFTEKQKAIYSLVLQANLNVFENAKPGALWQDLHLLAENTILEGLVKLGLLKGDIQQMKDKRVMWYFMPHSLGHYLGLYTHDLPGLKSKENDWKPMDKMYLRFKRKLEEGMVCTNEPGCYFINRLLEQAYENLDIAQFFQKEIIQQYAQEVGGIRIEDDFVVTKNGNKVLSKNLPKTIEDIENFFKNRENQIIQLNKGTQIMFLFYIVNNLN